MCWHHDLMKKLVRGLGVKGPVPYWSLGTYDWIWIVTIPAQGEARMVEKVQELTPARRGVLKRPEPLPRRGGRDPVPPQREPGR